MTKPTSTYDADTALTKLINLFGRPPLLRNEQFEDFKQVFAGLYAALGPEDFLIEVDVYHLSIETWRTFRLTRYEAVMLNKWEADQRRTLAKKTKNETLKEGMKEIRKNYPNAAETDPQYQEAITKLNENAAAEYESEINLYAIDLDYVQAYEECSASVEKMELRISRAHKRRDDILRQIAWWRLGLSKKLRKFSDAIIEGKGGSLAATSDVVSLIPMGELHG